jgi:SNF2 family DNA or RNA helicase
MDEQDLVDVEVTHEEPDDFFDAIAAADVADAADISDASETVDADASEVADAGATDFPAHRRTVIANRLLAGQPDTELRSLSTVDEGQVKLLEHQVDAAHRALFEMDGKALLADEVGLGKTIEVGMILRELHYRETDGSVLILTPAQLAKQWQGELATKFGLEFVCNYDEDFEGFDAHDCIITSIDTAKSDRHRDTVLARDWNVLVMDEAHYVKNEATDRYALVQNLTYDYAFFLTATPIQNELTDLYNVVSLLRPGLFGSRDTFHRYFLNSNQETLVNRNELQRRLREVMIRNRRAETDIDFTDRVIDTRTFEPSDAERDLYDAVTEYVRGAYSRDSGQKLVLMLLQKEVVSSPAALARTVRRKLGEPNERDERDRRGEQKGLRGTRGASSPGATGGDPRCGRCYRNGHERAATVRYRRGSPRARRGGTSNRVHAVPRDTGTDPANA